MGFTPDFLDEIRNRIAVSDIVARRVKLVRKGREHSGLCPFHSEKTPSFTVNDDKGFYHCFGCGVHGDIIKFVIETEGLSFPETVERLAGQAGLVLPEDRPEDRLRSQQRKSLYDVMEAAAKYYETQLVAQAGQEGAAYLSRRGLSRDTVKKFRLGYAHSGRTALKEALLSRDGISEEMMVEAGLLIQIEEETGAVKPSYDRFRHRVMFPITDRQGRVVAFGGRALDDQAKAKYLNSPETPLFHKGSLLYNLAGARKSSYDEGRVLVAEGYMDVIAMAQAGFTNAVAPLGTAVTAEQITELWKLAPEPVMCFDGDKAGVRAAYRVAERALPLLKAGHSLRFVHLPTGEDPDSFISSRGKQAFRDVLERAQPLVDTLWNLKTNGVAIDTPEQRAGLEKSLSETLSEISNKTIRGYYDKAFQDKLSQHLGGAFTADHSLANMSSNNASFVPPKKNHFDYWQKDDGKRDGFNGKNQLSGFKNIKDTAIFQEGRLGGVTLERLLILVILNHPWLLNNHHEEFATYVFESAELDKLRNEIIDVSLRESDLEHKSLKRHLYEMGYGRALEVIFKQGELKAEWFAWPDAAPTDVEQAWFHVVNRRRISDLEKDLKAAEIELAENTTDDVYTRFLALRAELDDAKGNEASIDGYGITSGRKKNS